MYFSRTLFDEHGKPTEVELICDKCGKIINVTNVSQFSKIKSDYCVVNDGAMIICDECTNRCKSGLVEYKKNVQLNDCIVKRQIIQPNTPKCPICGNTNLSKITNTKKVTKILAFGVFGMGDNGKTWKCNNCGSKF